MSVTYVDSSVRSGHNPLRDPRDRRLSRVAGPSSLVLFGVTGDLARKKLMPAVYDLANRGLLPPSFALVGFDRRVWKDEDFASEVKASVEAYSRTPFDEAVWNQLSEGIRFVRGEFDDDAAFERLAATLDEQRGPQGNHAFYLSIPPKAFELVCRQLSDHGLAQAEGEKWRRVVIEKPFGHNLASARQLNDIVGSKVPGTQMEVRDVTMDFGYGHAFTESSPEAYERLILGVLLGEPPLLPRDQEVELSWKIMDPFEKFWAAENVQPESYEPGSWGPASADELLTRDGRTWRRP